MKLKCVKDTEIQFQFAGLKVIEAKVDGLTLGKTYSAYVMSTGEYGNIPYFLVYNDNEKWEQHKPELFAPLED